MKLAIFGATGVTGRHLVEQALQAGHQVTVLVRPGASLPIEARRLQVITGHLDQDAVVQAVVLRADAVISVLGVRKGNASAICTDGVEAILQAMALCGVRRLIALSAYGASETRDASLFIRFVRKVIAGKMRDKDSMEALVRDSRTDWTLVRPPVLTNGLKTDRYRAGTEIRPGLSSKLSRADLAAFILQEAVSGAYIGKAPAVLG